MPSSSPPPSFCPCCSLGLKHSSPHDMHIGDSFLFGSLFLQFLSGYFPAQPWLKQLPSLESFSLSPHDIHQCLKHFLYLAVCLPNECVCSSSVGICTKGHSQHNVKPMSAPPFQTAITSLISQGSTPLSPLLQPYSPSSLPTISYPFQRALPFNL